MFMGLIHPACKCLQAKDAGRKALWVFACVRMWCSPKSGSFSSMPTLWISHIPGTLGLPEWDLRFPSVVALHCCHFPLSIPSVSQVSISVAYSDLCVPEGLKVSSWTFSMEYEKYSKQQWLYPLLDWTGASAASSCWALPCRNSIASIQANIYLHPC